MDHPLRSRLMADEHGAEPTQQTSPKKGKPMTIRVPTREEFDRFVKRVAGTPRGHKDPAETDKPPERSEP
jgi:hypothetical protein